jgi:SAM-dependent methyltransferase
LSAIASQRDAAYTTSRPDVCEMVPPEARYILDVGCSNGALGRFLKQVQPERSLFGIEFDAAFAQEAAKHLQQVVHADLNLLDWRLVFGERRFDCIIFADVLEHLINPQSCLRQAVQHLQPNGCLVISLPNIRHLSALGAIYFQGNFPQRDRGIFDKTHMRWFTFADAFKLFEDCGLECFAHSAVLRWGDRGGGLMNRLLNRLPMPLQRWSPVREFLGYQICFSARIVK